MDCHKEAVTTRKETGLTAAIRMATARLATAHMVACTVLVFLLREVGCPRTALSRATHPRTVQVELVQEATPARQPQPLPPFNQIL